MSKMESIKLKSGHEMPMLGLGTWRLAGNDCVSVIKKAIELGYTHIDTAEIYGNHKEVGRAIKGFDRSELFITSKLWRSDLAYKNVLKACDRALDEIGTEYLDLYLIHWPNDRFPISGTMKALNRLVEDGKVKSIGISNFDEARTEEAIKHSKAPIVTNQVEFHAHLYQKELLEYCKKNGIAVIAYSPLARGAVLEDTVIEEIAEKHGKTSAQVSLRWLVQHGIAVIPKSTNTSHLRANMDIFGWQLTKNEMDAIDFIKTENRIVNPSFENIPFFNRIPKRLLRTMSKLVKQN